MRRVIAACVCAALSFAAVSRADPADYAALVTSPDYRTLRYAPIGDASNGGFVDQVSGVVGRLVSGGVPVSLVNGPVFEDQLPSTGLLGGGAARFDGITQHAEMEASSFGTAFNGPDGASVVLWYRSFDTSRGAIAGVMNEDGSGFQLLLGANQNPYLPNEFQLTFAVFFAGGRGSFVTGSCLSVDFANADWHMLVGTYAGGQARVYSDGELLRQVNASFGGTGRVSAFDRDVALGASNGVVGGAPFLSTRKRCELAQLSLHARALSAEQVRALWHAGNGVTGAKAYNAGAARGWFQASAAQRVDATIIGDSNTLFGYADGGPVSGHIVGMTQGLKRVIPLYAGAVLPGSGYGGFVNEINAVTPLIQGLDLGGPPPAFVTDKLLPASNGFVSTAFYIAPGRTLGATVTTRGPLSWEDPKFPFDFTGPVEFHVTHATFGGGGGGGGGVIRPGVRRNAPPLSPLGEAEFSTDGAALGTGDAIVDVLVQVPAGPRESGQRYALLLNDPEDQLPAVGPAAVLSTRLVRADLTTGAAMSATWGVGGQATRFAADRFVNGATLAQLGEHLRQLVRHQPTGQERLLVQVIHGGNDVGDFRPAINADGTLSTLTSASASGLKLNAHTLILRVREAWQNAGYDPSRLVFVMGPYHPNTLSGPKIRSTYVRAWRELARDSPEFNIVAMDGMSVSSPEEFYARGWYHNQGSDLAHLSRAGYEGFGEQTWAALRDAAVGVEPSLGACCIGATCTVLGQLACTQTGGRFAGETSPCNQPNNPRSPCCKADFDQSGVLTLQDLFGFLDAWFNGDVRADYSGNGASVPPTVQSVFEYVSAWFGGC